MNKFESETYHIWRPDLYGIFQRAVSQKSVVDIQSHMLLDECNSADVELYGNILAINGQKAQFVVNDFDLKLGNSFPQSPACEYCFPVEMPVGEGGVALMEYAGRSIILDLSLQKNNLPEGLLLRISQPNRIRRLRRHERRPCQEGQILMPGLMLVDNEPASRRHVLALLASYYRRRHRPVPRIINISAGGVCLQINDQSGQRIMAAEESYLFFFFLQRPVPGECPTVLLGKKVGIFREEQSGIPALRIRFLKELVWNNPGSGIQWLDVEAGGSDTLRGMLAKWNEGDD